ncbi:unnamed protein product [Sphagnum troendelagicum]
MNGRVDCSPSRASLTSSSTDILKCPHEEMKQRLDVSQHKVIDMVKQIEDQSDIIDKFQSTVGAYRRLYEEEVTAHRVSQLMAMSPIACLKQQVDGSKDEAGKLGEEETDYVEFLEAELNKARQEVSSLYNKLAHADVEATSTRNEMIALRKEYENQGKYKVYNLCLERLYDASLLEGKVACFPFDDHNCPPLQLVAAFCQSAYLWLKGDLENVVVVHCKAGMARTGLMITSLLLYLKFFPTAEESINYYNQKRCVDGKGLVLPSQLRYVKYFERVLRDFNGETPVGRKCILRGIRLHKCPYWIRRAITISDHNVDIVGQTEDIWFSAPRKGVVVFALPGESWLNTNMMETRQILPIAKLDGFDKRRLPSPGFQVEVVILDHDAPIPVMKMTEGAAGQSGTTRSEDPAPSTSHEQTTSQEATGSTSIAPISEASIFTSMSKTSNLTGSDLDDYFGGPAFLAWARMGNLHGWGGPLPQAWLDQQLQLQIRILSRMRDLGMTPGMLLPDPAP